MLAKISFPMDEDDDVDIDSITLTSLLSRHRRSAPLIGNPITGLPSSMQEGLGAVSGGGLSKSANIAKTWKSSPPPKKQALDKSKKRGDDAAAVLPSAVPAPPGEQTKKADRLRKFFGGAKGFLADAEVEEVADMPLAVLLETLEHQEDHATKTIDHADLVLPLSEVLELLEKENPDDLLEAKSFDSAEEPEDSHEDDAVNTV
jgi:hypothetical protein